MSRLRTLLRRRRRSRPSYLPARFLPLWEYHHERMRGIRHTPEKDREMNTLKRQFDNWMMGH